MKTKIIQNIKSIILALILVVGVSYVSASSTWNSPTTVAPGNNADIPLNTSSTGQAKVGGLTLNTGGAVNGLIVEKGNTVLKGGVQITSGTPGVGKVLTSDASGNATWGAVAANTGGFVVKGDIKPNGWPNAIVCYQKNVPAGTTVYHQYDFAFVTMNADGSLYNVLYHNSSNVKYLVYFGNGSLSSKPSAELSFQSSVSCPASAI